jgi:O-methyltransferase involved in polyketide biosynthesis
VSEEWSGAGDPPAVDVTRPSVARVFDYLLGGKLHFEADRRAAEIVLGPLPEARGLAVDTRDCLRRAVRHLVGVAGVRQLVDLGSGLPSSGNAHEIAHRVDPGVRVLYVDRDPMVLSHARALLDAEPLAAVLDADVRDPVAVLRAEQTRRLIDLDEPFAVLASGILQHLDDDDASRTAAAIVELLPSGSYFMVGHFLDDGEPRAKEMEQGFRNGGAGTFRFRTWVELRSYFDGLDMVEPGLCYAAEWHPDEQTDRNSPVRRLYAAGLGRKP